MTLMLDTSSTKTAGWSADIHGRVFGGDDTPIFAQVAKKQNDRIDAPIQATKAIFDQIVSDAIEETKPFAFAQVVPQHAEKTPGEFFSRIISSIKKFFKEI